MYDHTCEILVLYNGVAQGAEEGKETVGSVSLYSANNFFGAASLRNRARICVTRVRAKSHGETKQVTKS